MSIYTDDNYMRLSPSSLFFISLNLNTNLKNSRLGLHKETMDRRYSLCLGMSSVKILCSLKKFHTSSYCCIGGLICLLSPSLRVIQVKPYKNVKAD